MDPPGLCWALEAARSPEEPAHPQGASPPGCWDWEGSPQGSAHYLAEKALRWAETQMECPGHCGFLAVTRGLL